MYSSVQVRMPSTVAVFAQALDRSADHGVAAHPVCVIVVAAMMTTIDVGSFHGVFIGGSSRVGPVEAGAAG